MANCENCEITYDSDMEVDGNEYDRLLCNSCTEEFIENRITSRMKDTNGWFSESLVEHDDKIMEELSQLIIEGDNSKVGKYVINMVNGYMKK